MDFLILAQQCAPAIEQQLVTRLMRRESGFNPYAIGLDGKEYLKPQPRSYEEAVQVAEDLIRAGKNFSVGIAQIHISNIRSFGLTWRQAFHACTNLNYGQQIFLDFHRRALSAGYSGDAAVYAALRGYNSGSVHATVSNQYASAILGGPPGAISRSAPDSRSRSGASGAAITVEPASAPRWEETATTRSDGQSKEFFEE